MEDQIDTVYVTGLGPEVTNDKLAELFGSIGVIKVPKNSFSELCC